MSESLHSASVSLTVAASFLVLVSATLRGQDVPPEVEVVASVKEKDGEHVLRFTLKNTSSRPIRIYNGRAPWEERTSTTIILAEGKSRRVLKQTVFPIEDPLPGTIELKPGQQIAGDWGGLTTLFSLTDILKKSDVDVFWSYQLETEDGRKAKRVGGWLMISRTLTTK